MGRLCNAQNFNLLKKKKQKKKRKKNNNCEQ